VHASISADPLPGVVLEGMGAGLPVVATNAGGTPEHLVDGVSGLLHEPGDVADLARALRRAAGTREERAALGAAARTSVRRYAPEVVVEEILAFYDRVRR
jgi:glycosyltransferase involved in cell wall biosynthesis